MGLTKKRALNKLSESLTYIDDLELYTALGKQAVAAWVHSYRMMGGIGLLGIPLGFNSVRLYTNLKLPYAKLNFVKADVHRYLVLLNHEDSRGSMIFTCRPMEFAALSLYVETAILNQIRSNFIATGFPTGYIRKLAVNDLKEQFDKVVKITFYEAYKLLSDPLFIRVMKVDYICIQR